MRKIIKGREPDAWLKYRCTPGAVYQRKPALAESLLLEQGYVCAYCEKRIDVQDLRVEHIKPRSQYPAQQLSYSNMVACCSGQSQGSAHCDCSKKDEEITLNLFTDALFLSISYKHDGTISSANKSWNDDINITLNLNCLSLKENRKLALDGLLEIIKKEGYSQGVLKRLKARYEAKDKGHKFAEYRGIILYYIDKKLSP